MGGLHRFRPAALKSIIALPETSWARSPDDILAGLHVDPAKGLSTQDVRRRLHAFGQNILREIKTKSSFEILINQFRNLIVYFLVAAALFSFAFGEHVEGAAISIVIVINAAIGFFTELKGVRSIEALRKLGSISSRVRRNGTISEITAKALVPGDIIILEGGDVITADLRIINASKVQADESVLTGESLPVNKTADILPAQTPLAERTNMLFKGTALTRGSGEAVVVATGMQTELGRISSLVEMTVEEETPLEKRLNQLGNWLVWVSIALAALVAVTGIMVGRDLFLMIETGIALAVASIPEGLPIVATIALARGVWRMAKRNALIKELSAVETLGATSLICTDKTGTLTENRLTAVETFFDSGRIIINERSKDRKGIFVNEDGRAVTPEESDILRQAIEISVLCNNAEIPDKDKTHGGKTVGDPLEVAFLTMAAGAGISRGRLAEQYPEEKEVAFDSDIKMMATYHRVDRGYRVAVKGAPENVLAACETHLTDSGEKRMSEEDRREWSRRNEAMAANGLRVLALAGKKTASMDEEPYANLQLIGLVGLMDPPRQDIKEMLQLCRDAGVRVIMATGDQAVTAQAIGKAVGLVAEDNNQVVNGADFMKIEEMSPEEKNRYAAVHLFARVSPSQKLDLIALHREKGAIVAMTGDGVN
ncbi:MAG: cation-translocating P-type ATPase, partial [Desulfobulbales bacterium]